MQQIYNKIVNSIKRYAFENNFKTAIVGLSGGIDSALVATLAVDALGNRNIYGVSMPSKVSSIHSQNDAKDLANRQKIHYRVENIARITELYVKQLKLTGLAKDNIQARIRGNILMAISNMEGQLVLATGNKSECMVGYSTIYGDTVGGFAPINILYKTEVWELAKWLNKNARQNGKIEPIPQNSIDKEPSAELHYGQIDKEQLPDYNVLDKMLKKYEKSRNYNDLTTKVADMVKKNAWKLHQEPYGPEMYFNF
jgi:NAD+ synthase (glutamine-hydrolysing)